MIKEVKTNAIFCDCCGRQMKTANGANVYADQLGRVLSDEGWYRNYNTHKDYCPHCWKLEERECEIDDEYQSIPFVVTKDGDEFEYEW